VTLQRIAWLAASLLVGAALIGLWQYIADARLVSPVFLPGPDRAWDALMRGFANGELEWKLLGTIERMIYGWLLASLVGIALGALIGISPLARAYLEPMLEFLRPLPASAIIPVAIALLGLSDSMVLAVIAFGALWPMLLSTIHGFAAVEPRLYEVSRLLGLSRWEVIRKIALPNAMPDILAGLRLGLTVALILAVVGEMLASRDGLGLWILLSARSFRAPELFAGVILLGLIGYASALLLGAVESRVLRWRGQ
jgi:ABC-type nitrate/sulfonate/bicarbonate transport system permease component